MTVHGPSLLLMLLFGHALADFGLQSQFMADGKNRHTAIGHRWWLHVLSAHAMIHAGFVTAFTGFACLGTLEFAVHWITDWLKCDGKIGTNTDQAVHIACKLVWWATATFLPA